MEKQPQQQFPAVKDKQQTSKSYITGVETSEITGLTVCGPVISNPVFICIFTLHADNNWLEMTVPHAVNPVFSLMFLLP